MVEMDYLVIISLFLGVLLGLHKNSNAFLFKKKYLAIQNSKNRTATRRGI